MTYTNYTEYKQALARGERGISFTSTKERTAPTVAINPELRDDIAAIQASHLDTNG